MSIKSWNNSIDHELIAYDLKNDNYKYLSSIDSDSNSKDFNNPISPITNFILNAWVNLFDTEKNLIINFPNKILKPIPLLAYLFSYIKSKSTLIYSAGGINNKDELISIHNRNYYSLFGVSNTINKYQLFNNCPMGFLSGHDLKTYPIFGSMSHTHKNQHKQKIIKDLTDSNKPKIVLSRKNNSTRITNEITNLFMEDKSVSVDNNWKLNLDVGCIIFENADRYISSKYKAETFIEWLKENVDSNIKLLFHFSNPNLDYMKSIKEITNSYLISFNRSILKNNKSLKYLSLDYFKDKSSRDLQIIGKYNLDGKMDYLNESVIRLDDSLLDKGNLDIYLSKANELSKKIEESKIKNKSLFYRTQNLFYNINNLTVNPSFLKFKLYYFDWSYVTIPQFIELFRENIERESHYNQMLLNSYLDIFNQYYLELTRCKRCGELNSFNKIGKDYRVLEIALSKEKYFEKDNDLIIGSFYDTEANILNRCLKNVDDVEAVYLGNLVKQYADSKNLNLLLPGFVPPKFVSELYKNYNDILILAYDGFNKINILQQIERVKNPSIEDEIKIMPYFEEIYNYIGETKNNAFINDFKGRKLKYDEEKSLEQINNVKEEEEKVINPVDYKYDVYKEFIRNIEKKLNQEHSSSSNYISGEYEYVGDTETVSLELLNVKTNEVVTKKLPSKKKYLHFRNYEKLDKSSEVRANVLKKNDFVIILENTKFSFLDLFIDIFGFEENIDMDLANYWKDALNKFEVRNNLELVEFHQKYVDLGGKIKIQSFRKWLKGDNISPQKITDLEILAKVMEDNYILNNLEVMWDEFRKIRSLHIQMGRQLKAIIKDIIIDEDSLIFSELSFEEETMRRMIENSVYKVLKVNK